MEVLIEGCAGLDVHKKTVVACVRTPGDGKCRRSRVRTFGTTMTGLEALGEWLGAHGVTHATMESTGVYWCPVYAVLEDRFALLLVNARHVKNVPGRKTDVKDSEWLARLLECGLLKGSFDPPESPEEPGPVGERHLRGQPVKIAVAGTAAGLSGRGSRVHS